MKGVGDGPVEAIVAEREENGAYENIYDLVKRVNLRTVNKKCMESLVLGGAFDELSDIHRAQYFAPTDRYDSFLEQLLKYGNALQDLKNQNQHSLFGDSIPVSMPDPEPPSCREWSLIEKLTKEKDVTGIYISGHPLDDYVLEVRHYTTCSIDQLDRYKDYSLRLAGLVVNANHRISQKGTGYGRFTIQDFNGSLEFSLFREDYQRFKDILEEGQAVFLEGIYRPGRSGEYEFFLKDVKLLESIGEQLTKSITLLMPLQRLDEPVMNSLDEILGQHEGNHLLKIVMVDPEEELSLSFVSSRRRVNADSHFIQKIESMGVKYKLN